VRVGGVRALVALARPRMLPYLWLLLVGGFGFAHWDRALVVRGLPELVALAVAWALLHAGTMWWNAALDEDDGPVLWGEPAPVPPEARAVGTVALIGCVATASLAGPWGGGAAAGAALLAVLYSHPRTAWKGHPVLGPLVNVVGYGILTPIAGFSAAGVPPTWRGGAVLVVGVAGVLAAYYAAQVFQEAEDRARGYRTLVATGGPAAALRAVRVCVALGFAGAVALAVIGWVPRVVLVGLPLGLWVDRGLREWIGRGDPTEPAHARAFARRLLTSALVALAVLFVAYLDDIRANRPVAGLATAAGHPPDRPLLPPDAMRIWEWQQRRDAGN
jgi:4-hydroxybenzoate polyprenyltransferase